MTATREEVEYALKHEAKLLDKLVVSQRRLLSRTHPHTYLQAIAEDDGSLAWWCNARGMRHVMIEACLKLQTAWRERPKVGYAAKLRLRQQRKGEREKLRNDLVKILEMREDLRAEALAYFESVAPPIMHKLTTLRRRLSTAQNNEVPAGSKSSAASSSTKVASTKAQARTMIAIVRAVQEEVVKYERSLYELQEALLMTFHGAKAGKRMAANARLNPAGLGKRLIKSEAALPTELAAFKATLGNAGVSVDADAKKKIITMERRRLLVAAVRAKPPETPMELWRAVRGMTANIDKCQHGVERVGCMLHRMARGRMTSADRETVASGNWAALNLAGQKVGKKQANSSKRDPSEDDDGHAGDALDRALRTWLPKGFGEQLGIMDGPPRASDASGMNSKEALGGQHEAAAAAAALASHQTTTVRPSSSGSNGVHANPATAAPSLPPKPVLWACSDTSASSPTLAPGAPQLPRPNSSAASRMSSAASRGRSVTPSLSEPVLRPPSIAYDSLKLSAHDVFTMGVNSRPGTATAGGHVGPRPTSPFARPFNPYMEGTMPAHEVRGIRHAYGPWEFRWEFAVTEMPDGSSPRAPPSPRPLVPPRARSAQSRTPARSPHPSIPPVWAGKPLSGGAAAQRGASAADSIGMRAGPRVAPARTMLARPATASGAAPSRGASAASFIGGYWLGGGGTGG